jgi:short-subunit dehydrogenase
MEFKDKVIWITGASSGIGEHLAYAFSKAGAKLALSARQEHELNRVKAACAVPNDVLLVPLDVANFADIPVATNEIISHYGYISILVNNAGISQRSLVKNTDFVVDQRIMDINYLGTVAVTKAVLPRMLQQRFGQIVVISSVMGKIGTPLRSAYAASKHALHGFFECLRAEVAEDGLAVTIICPGYVNTDITVNALVGDGSPNKMKAQSTAEGMDPDVFAQKALRAIAHRKPEVFIGGKELLMIYLQRLSPRLVRWLVTRLNVT